MDALDPIKGQIVISMIVTTVIERMKQASWMPFITQRTPRLNRALSAVFAAASAAGFVFGMTGSIEAGATLTLTVPPLSQVADFAVNFLFAYGVQQGVYHGYVKQDAVAPLEKQ